MQTKYVFKSLFHKHPYTFTKLREKIPASEYGARIRNINQSAAAAGREAMEMQVPNVSHYRASCLPYKEHLCQYG